MEERPSSLFKEVGTALYWYEMTINEFCKRVDHCPVCGYPTSDLPFKTGNNVHSLLQYRELGLWFLVAEMHRAHAAELMKRIVNISYPDPADQTSRPKLHQT